MDHQKIRKSIDEVTQAIENLNKVFEKRSIDLRDSGDVEGLKQWTKACQAMRDSGNIYITWARHYYGQTAETPGSSEEDDFLNEGAVWDDPQTGL
jgi:hypothetical protein